MTPYFVRIFFIFSLILRVIVDWLNSLPVLHEMRYRNLFFRFLLVLRHVFVRKMKMRLLFVKTSWEHQTFYSLGR